MIWNLITNSILILTSAFVSWYYVRIRKIKKIYNNFIYFYNEKHEINSVQPTQNYLEMLLNEFEMSDNNIFVNNIKNIRNIFNIKNDIQVLEKEYNKLFIKILSKKEIKKIISTNCIVVVNKINEHKKFKKCFNRSNSLKNIMFYDNFEFNNANAILDRLSEIYDNYKNKEKKIKELEKKILINRINIFNIISFDISQNKNLKCIVIGLLVLLFFITATIIIVKNIITISYYIIVFLKLFSNFFV